MPDATQAQAATESAQAAQTTTGEQSATAGAQTAQAAEAERFDAEYVRQLRAEAAQHRTKLREYEAARKAAEDAKLSETERTSKRLAELERQQSDWQRERQELTTRHAIERTAAKLGIVDPDAAYRLLDLAGIEYADDGSPKDVEKALQGLLKQRPYLAGQAQAASSGAATNPGSGPRGIGSGGTFTRRQYADRAFYLANKPALDRALAEGRIVEG